ncbi:AI-2E family transporter [Edaphobacillus lindanitolerans]|uniref:Predicted PurR-regulated permease PerM n=1 Tax=Edaphobacillus lindanitolerans TaxID=550447 RepID=A0A1U7PPB0_9BACI|nr:AI-2E family transporter [Edaphobacillus lindanitolerans]SIT87280.1 Predicted PurR-regulated permease PerM [Edaphobacillus lindanitolerans]
MTKKLWFQIGIALLLAFLIIKYFLEIKFIFDPLFIIAKTALVPVIFGGVLFYLAEPVQRRLEASNVPRWGSISIIIACAAVIIWVFVALIGPVVSRQVNNFVENAPALTHQLNEFRIDLLNQRDDLPEQARSAIDSALDSVEASAVKFGKWSIQFIQSLIQAVVLLILVPFFFIFMLKDHEKFAPRIYNLFHGKRREWVKNTLYDIDQVLRSYIQGQLLISTILATLIFVGYLIVGLDYALLLAIFALLMNVIPFLGPWIAFTPAAIIAFLQDPKMVIWVSLVTLAAQQIDSHLITPNVMGKTLDIHPLTVITLILAAGSIAGFFGILLAIPAYAVIKAVVINIYEARKAIKRAATKDI